MGSPSFSRTPFPSSKWIFGGCVCFGSFSFLDFVADAGVDNDGSAETLSLAFSESSTFRFFELSLPASFFSRSIVVRDGCEKELKSMMGFFSSFLRCDGNLTQIPLILHLFLTEGQSILDSFKKTLRHN